MILFFLFDFLNSKSILFPLTVVKKKNYKMRNLFKGLHPKHLEKLQSQIFSMSKEFSYHSKKKKKVCLHY